MSGQPESKNRTINTGNHRGTGETSTGLYQQVLYVIASPSLRATKGTFFQCNTLRFYLSPPIRDDQIYNEEQYSMGKG